MLHQCVVRMRPASAVAVSVMVCLLAAGCSAESASRFQSVSGEFAQDWISDFKVQNPQPVQQLHSDNGSDLWNWGSAPKGSAIVDGELTTDPYYLRPWLNLSSNWLGESYTDPNTGLPVDIYLDPLTGNAVYSYLNPNTGRPYYSYYSYLDPKTGKRIYAYINPLTGKPVYSAVSPSSTMDTLLGSQQSNGLALPQTFTSI